MLEYTYYVVVDTDFNYLCTHKIWGTNIRDALLFKTVESAQELIAKEKFKDVYVCELKMSVKVL